MKTDSSASRDASIGFAGALTLLFIGLKLTGYIDWSWWWILSPLILSAVISAIILVVWMLIACAMYLYTLRKSIQMRRSSRKDSDADRFYGS